MNPRTLPAQAPILTPRTRNRLLALAVASCFSAGAWALPVAPTVVGGSASFSQNGNVLNVKNSNGAIINWQSFSIGAGETTRFLQSSASSSVLNRVLAGDPSLIYGTLSSNGRVWLVNPAGILVGAGGRIDTAAFVASTLAVKNADFLANKLTFGSSDVVPTGTVVNQGTITTPQGGSVYLIGAGVENNGLVQTPRGETVLAAGKTVQLIDTGTPGVKVEVTGDGQSTNLGQIVADAGRIGLVGSLVKNSGTLNASSVVKDGGRVFLKASQDAYVDGDGRIVTTGVKGGRVEVLGDRVALAGNAAIDASGATGGGTVLVGGDYQGKNAQIQNAEVTYFGGNASVKADAIDSGNGGKVIFWADNTTRAYGSISARGGANSGNGGFVEVSGKKFLDFTAKVDTLAAKGKTGTLLLDPGSLTIGDSSWASTYQSLGSDLILQTDASGTGDITFNGSGANNTFGHNLSVLAYGGGASSGNIDFNDFRLSVTGTLTMVAGWDSISTGSPAAVTGKGTLSLNKSTTGSTLVSSSTANLTAGNGIVVDGSSIKGSSVGLISDALDIKHSGNVLAGTGGSYTGQIYIQRNSGGTIELGAGATNGLAITDANFEDMDAGTVVVASFHNNGTTLVGDIGSSGTPLPYTLSIQGSSLTLGSATSIYAGSNAVEFWVNTLSGQSTSTVNAGTFRYVPLTVGANLAILANACGASNCIEAGFLQGLNVSAIEIGHTQAGTITLAGTADAGGAAQFINSTHAAQTLTLKSNTGVDIHSGAVLKGSAGHALNLAVYGMAAGSTINVADALETYGGSVYMSAGSTVINGINTADLTSLSSAPIELVASNGSLVVSGTLNTGIGVTQQSSIGNAGAITLSASGDVVVPGALNAGISTDGSFSKTVGNGGDITITSSGGKLQLGTITTGIATYQMPSTSGHAGAVCLTAATTVSATSINTAVFNNDDGNTHVGHGGDVTIHAGTGITVGDINTSSNTAYWWYGIGNNSTAGAGNVLLESLTGNITTGNIYATSGVYEGFNASDGPNGSISIYAYGGNISTGNLSTASPTVGGWGYGFFGTTAAAGAVTVDASGTVNVTSINASSRDAAGADVTLNGASITVGSIDAHGGSTGGNVAVAASVGDAQTGSIYTYGSLGNAGDVSVSGANVAITSIDAMGGSDANAGGNGGNVVITATAAGPDAATAALNISYINASGGSASTAGTGGMGGDITLRAPSMGITLINASGGAGVSAGGGGGVVDIATNGAHAGFSGALIDIGSIAAADAPGGSGGSVSITAPSLSIVSIAAPDVSLDIVGDIGTVGTPVSLQAARLTVHSQGDVYLSNSGDLMLVGSNAANVFAVDGSGALGFVASGSDSLTASTLLLNASGDIDFNGADVGSLSAYSSAGGVRYYSSGVAALQLMTDAWTGGVNAVYAGGTFSGAAAGQTPTAIDLRASGAGGLLVDGSVRAESGSVSIASPIINFGNSASAGVIGGKADRIALYADDLVFGPNGVYRIAANKQVEIATFTANRDIGIVNGTAAACSPNCLVLDLSDLTPALRAPMLAIGRDGTNAFGGAASGDITLYADIDATTLPATTTTTTLGLTTAGNVNGNGHGITIANLGVISSGNVNLNTSVDTFGAEIGGSLTIANDKALTVGTVGDTTSADGFMTGISAGNAITLTSAGTLTNSGGISSGPGAISLTASSGNIVSNAAIASNGGAISLTATSGNVVNGAPGITSGGGDVTVTAGGSIATALINAGSGKVKLTAYGGGVIDLDGTAPNISASLLLLDVNGASDFGGSVGKLAGTTHGKNLTFANQGNLLLDTLDLGSTGDLDLKVSGTLTSGLSGTNAGNANLVGRNIKLAANSINLATQVDALDLLTSGNVVIHEADAVTAKAAVSGGDFTLYGGAVTMGSSSVSGKIALNASGTIAQTGGLSAASLVTSSYGGTVLDGANQVGSFTAQNDNGGDITLVNTASPLTLHNVVNNDPVGNVNIDNTGALDIAAGALISTNAGSLNMVAHSPITVNGSIKSGGNISLVASPSANNNNNLTINGAITSTSTNGSVNLSAGNNIVQNANITTSGAGVTLTATKGGITMATGTTTNSNGGTIGVTASGNIVLAKLNAGSGTVNLDAGGGISSAPGTTGSNVIAKTATISATTAKLSTSVKTLEADVSGNFTITDTNTGTVITDTPPPTTTDTGTTGVVQTGTNEVTKNITTSTNDNKTTSTPVEDIKWDSVLPSTSTTTAYIPVGHTLGGGNGEFGENDPSQSNKDKNKDKDKDSNTNNPNDNKPNDNKPSGSLPKC